MSAVGEGRDGGFRCRRGSFVTQACLSARSPLLRVRMLQGSCLQPQNPDQIFEGKSVAVVEEDFIIF